MVAAQEVCSKALGRLDSHGGTVVKVMHTLLKQNAHSSKCLNCALKDLFIDKKYEDLLYTLNKKEEGWNGSSKRVEDALVGTHTGSLTPLPLLTSLIPV